MGAPYTKLTFFLTKDEDDYPPADTETLWVRERGNELYEIDNLPWFARGISFGDIVSGRREGNHLVFDGLVQESGHSTLRVILFDASSAAISDIRAKVATMGCDSELSHKPGLVSIDIPPDVQLNSVISFLSKGEQEGDWSYEQGAVSENHRGSA